MAIKANTRTSPVIRFLRLLPALAGWASILLALAVLTGWHIHQPELIQVMPSFAPMQYNTALGFLFGGAGLIAILWHRYLAAQIFGSISFALGALTLIEYIFDISLGIDQLLMEHYILVKTSHPGRMAPNTAVNFALVGAAIACAANPITRKKPAVYGLLSILVISLSIAALFGYLAGMEDTYGWGSLTRMAIHTTVGFIVLGAGALGLAGHQQVAIGNISNAKWLPITGGTLAMAISIILAQSIEADEDRYIRRSTQKEAILIHSKLEKSIDNTLLTLERMARRWELHGGTPPTAWTADAQAIHEHFKIFQAIEWVDSDLIIRRVVPIQGNEFLLNLNLSTEPIRRKTLENARLNRKTTLTRTIELAQGGRGFLAYVPMFISKDGQELFDGFTLGVFRAEDLFRYAFETHESYGYHIVVMDGEHVAYQSRALPAHNASAWSTERTAQTRNITWTIKVMPTHQVVNAQNTYLSPAVIAVGFLFAILTSSLIHAGQVLTRKSRDAALANTAKSEFLARMSHEIRTPLTAIMGYVDFIHDAATEKDVKNWSERALSSSNHLLMLINDILDLSKIEAGEMKIASERENLPMNLATIETTMRPLATEKMLQLEFKVAGDLPQEVLMDALRFRQIAFNLIGNAVKFTEKGLIEIRVAVQRKPDDYGTLHFVVRDTGIGIPQDKIEHLFDPFVQAHTEEHIRAKGTGLGLSISRQLARMMGGNVTAESEVGRGSTFTASIRLQPVTGTPWLPWNPTSNKNLDSTSEPKANQLTQLHGLRVLIADDTEDNRHIVGYLLQKVGCEVGYAEDGQQALAAIDDAHAQGQSFQVLLVDIQMPWLDGFGVIRELNKRQEKAPAIALTAQAMRDDRENCLEAGFDDYLSKPIVADDLYALLRRYADKIETDRPPHEKPSSSMRSTMADDPKFAPLLQKYTAEILPQILEQMEIAKQSNDSVTLQSVFHRLAGSAASYGYQNIGDQARKYEESLRRGKTFDPKEIEIMLHMIKAAIRDAKT